LKEGRKEGERERGSPRTALKDNASSETISEEDERDIYNALVLVKAYDE